MTLSANPATVVPADYPLTVAVVTRSSEPHSNDPSRRCSPTRQRRAQLQALLRARTRLIVCFWTLPVYVVAVWILLEKQGNIGVLMYTYMAIWAGFAVDVVRRPCPSCLQQFFVKFILINPITKSCVHCGLHLGHAQWHTVHEEAKS